MQMGIAQGHCWVPPTSVDGRRTPSHSLSLPLSFCVYAPQSANIPFYLHSTRGTVQKPNRLHERARAPEQLYYYAMACKQTRSLAFHEQNTMHNTQPQSETMDHTTKIHTGMKRMRKTSVLRTMSSLLVNGCPAFVIYDYRRGRQERVLCLADGKHAFRCRSVDISVGIYGGLRKYSSLFHRPLLNLCTYVIKQSLNKVTTQKHKQNLIMNINWTSFAMYDTESAPIVSDKAQPLAPRVIAIYTAHNINSISGRTRTKCGTRKDKYTHTETHQMETNAMWCRVPWIFRADIYSPTQIHVAIVFS